MERSLRRQFQFVHNGMLLVGGGARRFLMRTMMAMKICIATGGTEHDAFIPQRWRW